MLVVDQDQKVILSGQVHAERGVVVPVDILPVFAEPVYIAFAGEEFFSAESRMRFAQGDQLLGELKQAPQSVQEYTTSAIFSDAS